MVTRIADLKQHDSIRVFFRHDCFLATATADFEIDEAVPAISVKKWESLSGYFVARTDTGHFFFDVLSNGELVRLKIAEELVQVLKVRPSDVRDHGQKASA